MAVVILMFTFVNFSNNQVAFTEGSSFVFNEIKRLTDMIADGASSTDISIAKAAISTDIQYMERLGVMLKQSSSNDLFAFIYVFLSSVLIGVGAYLLSRGESYVEKLKEMHSNLKKNYSELAKKQTQLDDNSKALMMNQDDLNKKYTELLKRHTELKHKSGDLSKEYSILKEQAEQNEYSILFNHIFTKLSEVHAFISFYRKKSVINDLVSFTERLRDLERRCDDDIVDFSKVNKRIIASFSKQFEEVIVLYESAAERDEKEDISGGINEAHKKIIYKCFEIIENKLKKC
jgi:hypothetical protein